MICYPLSRKNSITDIDQRICPTAMQTVSWCRRARMSRLRSAKMPFTSVKRHNSCLHALVSVKTVPIKIWNQKGSLNVATFAEYTRTLCMQTRCSMLSCPAGMPNTQLPRFAQTPLPSFAELMRRIENAANNQTARNPEFTVLDSVGMSGRRVGNEVRDGES